MPDRIVSHALEQVEESHDVAVDVGIGVFDRIAYAGPVGLRGAFG